MDCKTNLPPRDLSKITWEYLVAQEPFLQDLLSEALAIKDDGARFCANARFTLRHGGQCSFRERIAALVGWYSPHVDTPLETGQAYRVACDTIMAALPECRNCRCAVPSIPRG